MYGWSFCHYVPVLVRDCKLRAVNMWKLLFWLHKKLRLYIVVIVVWVIVGDSWIISSYEARKALHALHKHVTCFNNWDASPLFWWTYRCSWGLYLCLWGLYHFLWGMSLCLWGMFHCLWGMFHCLWGMSPCSWGTFHCLWRMLYCLCGVYFFLEQADAHERNKV